MSKGKKHTILVTGAGQRLGKAIARALAKTGQYDLVLHYFQSKKETQALARKIQARSVVQADLNDTAEVARIFSEIGDVDILVHAVGSFIFKPLSETSTEEFASCIENNLLSAWSLAKAALPTMRRHKFGRLIFFGSSGCDQLTARPLTTPYYIAKTGLLMITRSLAREEAGNGITVNMVTPGVLPSGVRPAVDAPIIPFDAVARAVVFLVSSGSQHINGANLEVTGGWRVE